MDLSQHPYTVFLFEFLQTLQVETLKEKDELALVMKFQSVNELRDNLMNLTEKVNSENLLNTWNDLFYLRNLQAR